MPGPIDLRSLARAAARAFGWAFGLWAVVAVPFLVGFRLWWTPRFSFSLHVGASEAVDEILGQLLVIALPEEAFYRGFLQSRLDDVWAPRWCLLGARFGPGLLTSAAIFAVGHVVTMPVITRLAVFFPALLFGWLRARTGGIGASVVFHALCNLYVLSLMRGFGL